MCCSRVCVLASKDTEGKVNQFIIPHFMNRELRQSDSSVSNLTCLENTYTSFAGESLNLNAHGFSEPCLLHNAFNVLPQNPSLSQKC